MSGGWAGSTRKDDLPPDWWKIRKKVLERDGHRCTVILPSGKRCPREATDVDHLYGRTQHAMWALKSKCAHHHGKKSAQEGVEARMAKKKSRRKREDPGAFDW